MARNGSGLVCAVLAAVVGVTVAATPRPAEAAYDTTIGGTPVQIEYEAGTGSKSAVVVVDFNTSASYAFLYHWDGDANSWMALEAIDAAGSLDKWATNYGPGLGWFLDDFAYPSATKRGTDIGFFTSADGLTWSMYWASGPSGRVLTDGDWDGWCFGSWGGPPDYLFSPADGPVTPAPEPATLCAMLLGGAALLRRFRTQ